MGLVPTDRYSDNTFVNAFEVQYEVLSTILDSAEAIYSKEDVYCVDSFNNGQLNRYSPAIWQNYIFFLELFGKAYLSVSGKKVERIHSLLAITNAVKNTMYELSHNDTLFHAYAISNLRLICDEIFGASNFLADLIWQHSLQSNGYGGKTPCRLSRQKCTYALQRGADERALRL